MRILGTIFAGLFGLVFGSFLNVCLSRWPEGESVVKPRSRCRACGRTLTWWENVPVVSWLALRGRCRICGAWIGARYVVVELAVGGGWGIACSRFFVHISDLPKFQNAAIVAALGSAIFSFILVGLAVLDAEHLWLPDLITYPAILLGLVYAATYEELAWHFDTPARPLRELLSRLLAALLAAALVLLIRWLYWLIRRKEGLGLGDVKLMAMLAAWLGLPGALLALFIGVVIGAGMGVTMLLMPKRNDEAWATRKLPLGTFLCIGGIVSSLWGQQIIATYLRWAGF
ncbi:prepilin peptidase [Terracidiphilus gabretensis]|uniref:prepilin peptidase n=1 Tax=Terracidiphilus gabretensis TaxID=1577687 RepID=UPI0018D244C9|nr:A24 family peptidase [Terracidiphilus gabretensis]